MTDEVFVDLMNKGFVTCCDIRYKGKLKSIENLRYMSPNYRVTFCPTSYKEMFFLEELHSAIATGSFYDPRLDKPDIITNRSLVTLIPRDLYNLFKHNSFDGVLDVVRTLIAISIVDGKFDADAVKRDVYYKIWGNVQRWFNLLSSLPDNVDVVEHCVDKGLIPRWMANEDGYGYSIDNKWMHCDLNWILDIRYYGLHHHDIEWLKKSKLDDRDGDDLERTESSRMAFDYYLGAIHRNQVWSTPDIDKEAKEDNSGYVYLMSDGDKIKIGYTSKNVFGRMDSLQTGNPRPLHVLYYFPASIKTEGILHEQYKRQWIRGKWYDLSPVQIEEIKSRYW